MAKAPALHLRAEDAEDLAVLSSCLQDALAPLSDMRYDAAKREFVVAMNRFRWEGCAPELLERKDAPRAVFERVACGIVFEGVSKVSVQGVDQHKRDQLLELLAILTGDGAAAKLGHDAGGGETVILLVFAGGATIRLDVEGIRCRIDDFGEPWPTQWRPWHRIEA